MSTGSSTMVEQSPYHAKVKGSIPAARKNATKFAKSAKVICSSVPVSPIKLDHRCVNTVYWDIYEWTLVEDDDKP